MSRVIRSSRRALKHPLQTVVLASALVATPLGAASATPRSTVGDASPTLSAAAQFQASGEVPTTQELAAITKLAATNRNTASATGRAVTGARMSCLKASVAPLPGLQAWPNQVRAMIVGQFGVPNIGGYRPGRGSSDHHTGLALDVMVMKDKARGDRVAAWAIQNSKQLNLKYVIWYQRIWLPSSKTWRPMANRGSATANHFDHPHLSFNKGTGSGC